MSFICTKCVAFSIIDAILPKDCDIHRTAVCIIIFSLHFSCLIISNFENSQAVNTFVEIFSICMLPKIMTPKGSFKVFVPGMEFEWDIVDHFQGIVYLLHVVINSVRSSGPRLFL